MPPDTSPTTGAKLTFAVAISLAAGVAIAYAVAGVGAATAWSGLAVVAGLVLVASGVAKMRDPAPAATGLAGIGLRLPARVMRAIGIGEVALGAATAVIGSAVVCVLAAMAYIVFAVVATRMWRTEGVSSCGCFGDQQARPGLVHVAVNIVSAVALFGAAATSSGAALAIVDSTPWFGLPALAAATLGAIGIVALLTVAAETDALADGPAARDRTFRLLEDA